MAALQVAIPDAAIAAVIVETGTQERRKRRLPARLVVAFVLALGLWAREGLVGVICNLVDGLREQDPSPWRAWEPPVKSAQPPSPRGRPGALRARPRPPRHPVPDGRGCRQGRPRPGPPQLHRHAARAPTRQPSLAARPHRPGRLPLVVDRLLTDLLDQIARCRLPPRRDRSYPRVVKWRQLPFNPKRPKHAHPPKPHPVADTLHLRTAS